MNQYMRDAVCTHIPPVIGALVMGYISIGDIKHIAQLTCQHGDAESHAVVADDDNHWAIRLCGLRGAVRRPRRDDAGGRRLAPHRAAVRRLPLRRRDLRPGASAQRGDGADGADPALPGVRRRRVLRPGL